MNDLSHPVPPGPVAGHLPRKAVYAASLDPVTNGHINVVERVAPLYDEVLVVVAVDARKTYTFSPGERVAMARAAVAHIPNARVDVIFGQYVVKYAEAAGARVIIRGLRTSADLEAERTLATENLAICPHIETMWLPCAMHLMHVSSSMVKGHVGIDPGWEEQVARSVPPAVVAKLKEKYILGKARWYWESFIAKAASRGMPASPAVAAAVFEDLIARYQEPHRAYHNLEHIVSMLEGLEEWLAGSEAFLETALQGGQIATLTFAIWFHDSVYEPKSKTNEEDSAVLARRACQRLGFPEAFASEVSAFILVTRHTAAATGLPPDMQVMVDLDLAILGRIEKEFLAYEDQIRQEYSWVSPAEYATGRTSVLRSFLDRPAIYATPYFHGKYEAAARRNLTVSIDALKA